MQIKLDDLFSSVYIHSTFIYLKKYLILLLFEEEFCKKNIYIVKQFNIIIILIRR